MISKAPQKAATLTIDGKPVTVPEGTTIWDAARQAGIEIPVLCHDTRLRPVGVCRVCVVEVEGARSLVASCAAPVANNMVVRTESPNVIVARKMVLQLLLSSGNGKYNGESILFFDRSVQVLQGSDVLIV